MFGLFHVSVCAAIYSEEWKKSKYPHMFQFLWVKSTLGPVPGKKLFIKFRKRHLFAIERVFIEANFPGVLGNHFVFHVDLWKSVVK